MADNNDKFNYTEDSNLSVVQEQDSEAAEEMAAIEALWAAKRELDEAEAQLKEANAAVDAAEDEEEDE